MAIAEVSRAAEARAAAAEAVEEGEAERTCLEASVACKLRLSACFLALGDADRAFKAARAVLVGTMGWTDPPPSISSSSSPSPSSSSSSSSSAEMTLDEELTDKGAAAAEAATKASWRRSWRAHGRSHLPGWLQRHLPEALYRYARAALARGNRLAAAGAAAEEGLALVDAAQAEAAALRDLCPSASHRHLGGGSSGGYYTHAPASSLTTKSSSSDGSSGATVVVVGWSEWALARRTPERLRGALHAAQGEIQQQKRSEGTEK